MGEEAEARRNPSTGTLRFVPTHDGEPQSIDVYMEQKGQMVFSKRLSVAQNRDLNMMPGIYEIKVTPVKLKAKPQSFSLTVVGGKRVGKEDVVLDEAFQEHRISLTAISFNEPINTSNSSMEVNTLGVILHPWTLHSL